MSTTYATGTPCWVDLMTPDPAQAEAFYGQVLGWTYDKQPEAYGGYLVCKADGATVAGIGKPPAGTDMPAAWTPYLATTDVAATVARMTEAGGTVLRPPMEVPRQGHMAIVADPSGAVVGLWQPLAHHGFDVLGSPGAACWFEVNTWKGPEVREFFATVFRLAPQKLEGMDYWTLHHGGRPRYGVLQMTKEWEGLPPHWSSYFAVEDTDAAAARVRDAGGHVKHGPFDTPFGRMAVCADPGGALFSLIKPNPQS